MTNNDHIDDDAAAPVNIIVSSTIGCSNSIYLEFDGKEEEINLEMDKIDSINRNSKEEDTCANITEAFPMVSETIAVIQNKEENNNNNNNNNNNSQEQQQVVSDAMQHFLTNYDDAEEEEEEINDIYSMDMIKSTEKVVQQSNNSNGMDNLEKKKHENNDKNVKEVGNGFSLFPGSQTLTTVSQPPQSTTTTTTTTPQSPSGPKQLKLPLPKDCLYNPEKIVLSWKKVQGLGAGLKNLGNTCYLNAVLQCLAYLPPFANYCLYDAERHSRNCSFAMSQFCVLCELENCVRRMLLKEQDAVVPQLAFKVYTISSHFKRMEQQDAHELLLQLCDAAHRCVLRTAKKGIPQDIKDSTIVQQIFGGFMRSRVRCGICNKPSDTFEPFCDLSLSIDGCCTLEECLKKFMAMEKVGCSQGYLCEKCGKRSQATKQSLLEVLPNALCIHFKRFDPFNVYGGKITRHVKFPSSISLKEYCSGTAKNAERRYHLCGVVVHAGSSISHGHYYAYVKATQGWGRMDDSMVCGAEMGQVLGAEAYILFYAASDKPVQGPASMPPPLPSLSLFTASTEGDKKREEAKKSNGDNNNNNNNNNNTSNNNTNNNDIKNRTSNFVEIAQTSAESNRATTGISFKIGHIPHYTSSSNVQRSASNRNNDNNNSNNHENSNNNNVSRNELYKEKDHKDNNNKESNHHNNNNNKDSYHHDDDHHKHSHHHHHHHNHHHHHDEEDYRGSPRYARTPYNNSNHGHRHQTPYNNNSSYRHHSPSKKRHSYPGYYNHPRDASPFSPSSFKNHDHYSSEKRRRLADEGR